MELSRRKLLQGLAVTAGLVAAGGVGLAFWRDDLHRGARDLYHRLTDPPPPDSPTGPLDPATAAVLGAAAEGLVGPGGRGGHYLAPFRWRAAHLPGYLDVYRRFARFVDAGARRHGGSGFPALPPEHRRRLLAAWFPPGRLRQALLGWAAPERGLLRRHVVEEILFVYSATDAWTGLGYDGWPGQPRGLEAYRRPPETEAGA